MTYLSVDDDGTKSLKRETTGNNVTADLTQEFSAALAQDQDEAWSSSSSVLGRQQTTYTNDVREEKHKSGAEELCKREQAADQCSSDERMSAPEKRRSSVAFESADEKKVSEYFFELGCY